MVRIFCIASLALAAVSAVSGHVIRHRRGAPPGWETEILQKYGDYHERYLQWDCQKQHNTTFFKQCCHPLLNGESIVALTQLGCKAPVDECDDGESSVPPSTPSSSSQPTYTTPSPETPHSSLSGSLEKFPKNAPAPSPAPTESTTTKVTTSSPPPAQTPTTSSPPPAQTPTTSPPAPAQTPSTGGDFNTGGEATFFYQKGNPGACGQIHQDSDFIAAIDQDRYGDAGNHSDQCGKRVEITNTENGKTVTVTIADDCPTCTNTNSIDLSITAFKAIGDMAEGVLPIKWRYV